ncbi:MAG TPA: hypothetical protein ENI23_00645 [bacterium]|nr:hypothetical protein [bacterium]
MALPFKLPGLKSIAERAGGEDSAETKKALAEQRRDLVRVNTKLSVTQTILEDNRKLLEGVAKSDKAAASVLASLSERSAIDVINEKIINQQVVSPEEGQRLVKDLDDISENIDQLGLSFDVNVSKLIDNLESLVLDERIDRETRRDTGKDIQNFIARVSKDQTKEQKKDKDLQASFKKVAELNFDTMNFTAKQNVAMLEAFGEVSEQTKNFAPIVTTLSDLEKSNKSAIITNQEIKKVLDEKDEKSGLSFRDKLSEKGLEKGGLGRGLISTLLASVGLGGLDDTLGLSDMLGDRLGRRGGRGRGGRGRGGLLRRGFGMLRGAGGGLVRGAGSLLSRVPGMARGGALLAGGASLLGGGASLLGGAGGTASTVGGVAKGGTSMLGGIAKMGGGLLKGAGSLLSKAALPLLIIKGLFDFGSGFMDASKIAGLKEGEEASLGTKIQAGLSSTISGLTFGIVDTSTIFQGIDKVGSFFSDAFLSVKDSLMGEGGIWDTVKGWGGAIVTGASDKIVEWTNSFLTDTTVGKWALSKAKDIGNFYSDKFTGLKDSFMEGDIWGVYKNWGSLVSFGLTDKLGEWTDSFLKDTEVGNFISDTASSVGGFFSDKFEAVKESWKNMDIGKTLKGWANILTFGLSDKVADFSNSFGKDVEVKDAVSQTLGDMGNFFSTKFKDIRDTFTSKIEDIGGSIASFFGFGPEKKPLKTLIDTTDLGPADPARVAEVSKLIGSGVASRPKLTPVVGGLQSASPADLMRLENQISGLESGLAQNTAAIREKQNVIVVPPPPQAPRKSLGTKDTDLLMMNSQRSN